MKAMVFKPRYYEKPGFCLLRGFLAKLATQERRKKRQVYAHFDLQEISNLLQHIEPRGVETPQKTGLQMADITKTVQSGPSSHPQPATAADHRAAVTASFLGWTLDAFDFFLVTLALPAIAEQFKRPESDIALSIFLTLGFRPVGAFIFGALADRYGRRLPLMIDLVFYSLLEVLTGLAPNYWSFMVFRALFGIGMGGEWGVGATLAMEKVPAKYRGLLSGMLQEGYAVGNLLASACAFLVLPRYGWRPMFFIGGLPALLAIFVRLRVKESEVWERSVKHESFRHLFRAILSHWKIFLYLALMMMAMNLVSHGTQDMYPALLKNQWKYSARQYSALTAFSMVGAVAGGLCFGFYSDRAGRRRAMILALLLGVAIIPIWAVTPGAAHVLSFVPLGVLLYTGAFLMQFMVQGAWGVIPAHLTEMSPDSVRGFMPGFAYQTGVLLASWVPYAESALAPRYGYALVMSVTAVTVLVFAVVVAALGRERRAAAF
jgi:SHS family lactate transporter-like MFS transporter